MIDVHEMTGKTYGKLTVTGFSHRDSKSNIYFDTKCSCGNNTKVYRHHLLHGKSTSCGKCINIPLKNESDYSYTGCMEYLNNYLKSVGVGGKFTIMEFIQDNMSKLS